jgi:acetyl-CoA carboxylase biotin carboxyl carrier protein
MKIKEIQEIIANFENSSLQTLELELDGFKLKLSKLKEPLPTQPETHVITTSQPITNTKESEQNKGSQQDLTQTIVKSPLVGTYYASPSPDQKPYIEPGSAVKKGQVLCIIEAMKIMNEITSPVDGFVHEILVKNGDIIQYDQVLVTIGERHAK